MSSDDTPLRPPPTSVLTVHANVSLIPVANSVSFLATAPDTADPRDGVIYTYFQSTNTVVRSISYGNPAPGLPPAPGEITVPDGLRVPAPLAMTPLRRILCPQHSCARAVLRLFSIASNHHLIQLLPTFVNYGLELAHDSRIAATSNIEKTWIHYQKPGGDATRSTIYECEIVKDENGKEVIVRKDTPVSLSAKPGTNIAGVETMMAITENPGPAACCRYIVYMDAQNNVHFNYVDAPGGKPAIEIIYTIRNIRSNSALAVAAVIDILAVYFFKEDGFVWRVNRGLYGWGTPRRVGAGAGARLAGNDITPPNFPQYIPAVPNSPLAATNDSDADERMVLVTYIGRWDNRDVIVSFHDRVTSDNCCNHCPRE